MSFLKELLNRNTISVDSPKAFPTTGINVVAAALTPFAVSPSILLVKPPSSDKILTNTVITNPKTQIILDFRKFANFPIWILSDKLEIIPIAVAINVIGRISIFIVFPINTIANIITGCTSDTDVTLPRSCH